MLPNNTYSSVTVQNTAPRKILVPMYCHGCHRAASGQFKKMLNKLSLKVLSLGSKFSVKVTILKSMLGSVCIQYCMNDRPKWG